MKRKSTPKSDARGVSAIDRRLGERMRTRRLELGMSQEELAKALGITFQQIQKYEKGVNRIAASRLYAIAAELKKPVGEFYAEIGLAAGHALRNSAIDFAQTNEGAELIRLFSTIRNPAVRASLVRLTATLIETADKAPG